MSVSGTLWNSRCQHPVGQGFFHTGVLSLGGKELRYAYDCGSEHTQPLSQCIDAYVSELTTRRNLDVNLDVLFLSHLHKDHVNGLDALLGEVGVHTVVLPYLSPEERFAAIASSLDEPLAGVSFFELLHDPPRWFADRGAYRVIQVQEGKGHAPELPKLVEPTLPLTVESPRLGLEMALKETSGNEIPTSHETAAKLFIMPHTNLMRISANQKLLNWTFLTFVHPEDANLKRFRKIVEKAFGTFPPENKWLVGVVQDSAKRQQLRSCYEQVWPEEKLNLTSLSVYSGPITLAPCFRVRTWCQPGVLWSPERDPMCVQRTDRCAWLGTGDSDLRTDLRRRKFMQHFRPVTNLVYSLALPHHGSSKNFHHELLDIGSPICVIAAGYRHGHPDAGVIREVLDRKRIPVTVDQYPASMWREEVALSVD